MRRYFGLLGVAFSIVLLCSSCLKDNDSTGSVAYNDMAISAFSLGTLNQYLHTVSSTGADSVYKQTLTGSDYNFYIDQVNREIYNPDSLPVGTDVKHVVCSISTYNNGVIWLFDEEDERMIYYTSSDSIDFTNPVKVRVYAYGSDNYSTYTVRVNVHQQDADEYVWNQMSELSGAAKKVFDEIQAGNAQAVAAGMKQYVGRSTTECYALTDDNRLMMSEDDGLTWTEEALDTDGSLLPVTDIACTCYVYSSYQDMDYVLMVGSRDRELYPQDKGLQVWHKIVDYSATAQPSAWAYMEVADNNTTQYLPRLEGPSLLRYNGKVLCIGLYEKTLVVYESMDGGITWNESSDVDLPESLQTGAAVTAVVDKENYIWVQQPTTGQLWRGRLNKLGWK